MIKLFVIFMAIMVVVLPFWAITNLLASNKKDLNKVLWVIVIILFPFLGSILYFLHKD